MRGTPLGGMSCGMRRWWTILWLAVASLPAFGEPVIVVSIREDISRNTVFLIRRALREAGEKQAVAVVLELDTNGGRVDATEEIIRLLERAPVKTYAFVNAKAYSAGAFIAAATDRIYMSPGSVIGAATPVMMMPGGGGVAELPKSYEEKITSAMRALIRATAQAKGHNPDVFDAMVDKDRGLAIGDTVIVEKGKLLTLTNAEAARAYGAPAKPLLSAGTVKSVAELLAQVGLPGAAVVPVQPYGFEVLARWLTMLSPVLVMIGFVAIYLELKTPGLGVPTVVAVICFGLYFIGYIAAGLAGWEEAVLFAVGLALLAVEVFVLPGFGVAGVAGLACILAALVLAMVEHFPGGPRWPAWSQVQGPLATVLLEFAGSVVVMMLLARFLPETRLFRKMELAATTSGYKTAGATAAALRGATGVAETPLRPAGKGRFNGQLVDVVTEGDWIEQGASIRITLVEGSRVVVTRGSCGTK